MKDSLLRQQWPGQWEIATTQPMRNLHNPSSLVSTIPNFLLSSINEEWKNENKRVIVLRKKKCSPPLPMILHRSCVTTAVPVLLASNLDVATWTVSLFLWKVDYLPAWKLCSSPPLLGEALPWKIKTWHTQRRNPRWFVTARVWNQSLSYFVLD